MISDASPTSTFIVPLLARKRNLTITTNALAIQSALVPILEANPTIKVVSAGGMLQPRSRAFMGMTAEQALEQYFVDISFLRGEEQRARAHSCTGGEGDIPPSPSWHRDGRNSRRRHETQAWSALLMAVPSASLRCASVLAVSCAPIIASAESAAMHATPINTGP